MNGSLTEEEKSQLALAKLGNEDKMLKFWKCCLSKRTFKEALALHRYQSDEMQNLIRSAWNRGCMHYKPNPDSSFNHAREA